MLKKIVAAKTDIDAAFAQEIAKACAAFDARIGIETGKRTVKGTDARQIERCLVKAGERVRLMIEGPQEQEAYCALRELIGGAGAL